mmetsp:Transcript_3085/g.10132  ORF Transcript_3085/g.10132 Transcript_3085/m.10132 type:complete len:363 (-) Transcript_3085:350-1438(-)
MRFPMNPKSSPASTVVFLSLLPMAMAVATAAGPVRAPRTFSKSRMTFAGLKKCMPTTRAGSATAPAMPSMDSVDVLLARTQDGFVTRSKSAKMDRFTAMSSKTASTTRSQSFKASTSDADDRRSSFAVRASSVSRPRLKADDRRYVSSTPDIAAAAASADVSRIVTGRPLSTKHMAMPRPMVPPPTTPAARTSTASSGDTPGTLEHARSAKKRCCSALACVDPWSSRKRASSKARPSCISLHTAASTHWMMDFGASSVARALSLAMESASLKPSTSTAFVRRTGDASTTLTASASKSALATTASTAPSASASLADTWRPVTMISAAASAPTSRGRRCVPPAPGRMPRCTSGKPTRAQLDMTR